MVYVGFLEIKNDKKREDVIKKWTIAAKAWKKKYPEAGTWRLYGRILGIGPKPAYLAILEYPDFATIDKFAESNDSDPEIKAAEDDWAPMIDEFQASIMQLLSEVD